MPVTPVELRPLDPGDGVAAQRLLAGAFADDPHMRWCFLGDEPGYQERLAAYCAAGHAWHTASGFPVQAAYRDGSLVGVNYAMDAHAEPPTEGVPDLVAELRAGCGERASRRFFESNDAADAYGPERPALLVALVAAAPGHQGSGIGSALMRWALERARTYQGTYKTTPFLSRHGVFPYQHGLSCLKQYYSFCR